MPFKSYIYYLIYFFSLYHVVILKFCVNDLSSESFYILRGGEYPINTKINSVKETIEIIKDALKKEAYSAAFFCSLSLPDICSQIEYKQIQGKKDLYIRWYNECIYKYEIPDCEGGERWNNIRKINKLDGEFIYLLRCKLFHEGELYHKELDELLNSKFQKDYKGKTVKLEINLNSDTNSFGFIDDSCKLEEVIIRIRLNQKTFAQKLMYTAEGLVREVSK